MAEARRRAGLLEETVLRLLHDQALPVSGVQLAEMLEAEGLSIQHSLVFRALRRLIDRGVVRKIALAKGYVRAGGGAPISLVCHGCGAVCEAEDAATLARLEAAVATRGFAAARYIVEVPGLCARCTRR